MRFNLIKVLWRNEIKIYYYFKNKLFNKIIGEIRYDDIFFF